MSQLPFMRFDEALPEVGRALRDFHSAGAPPTGRRQNAIRTVWSAVDNTRMYIRQINDGKVERSAPNGELVTLWSEASLAIAEFDNHLSMRLRDKAEYWSDPRQWAERGLDVASIAIDKVADDARALLQLAVPQPPAQRSSATTRTLDAFISHASEDKDAVARPLAQALRSRGYEVWLDEAEVTVGDHLTARLDEGLAQSRFGVLVLSSHFFAKNWPQLELQGLLALEASDGRKRILPVRHEMTQEVLAQTSPLVAARVSVSTERGIPAIADALAAAMR